MKSFRRPIACMLLVCLFFSFVVSSPAPSRAALPIVPLAWATGRALLQRGAMMLGRTASWSRTPTGLATTVGVGMSFQGVQDAVIGLSKQIGKSGKWVWDRIAKKVKDDPLGAAGDAADIVGTLNDVFGSDSPMGEAAKHALNPSGSSDQPGVGDIITVPDCGRVAITAKRTSVQCANKSYTYNNSHTCSNAKIYRWGGNVATDPNTGVTNVCCSKEPCELQALYTDLYSYTYDLSGTPEPSPQGIPEKLTPEQEKRLLDKIEEFLKDPQKAPKMEEELDDFLKKDPDTEWPEVSPDDVRQYMSERKAEEIQNEIDRLREELERKQRERENCQENCTGNQCCTNQCCDSSCDESRIANRIDQLGDRIDDLRDQQINNDLDNSYQPSAIPQVELKKVDFQPVVDLKGSLMSKFPFNMLQILPSAFEVLTAEPVAPYWDANLGEVGGTHRVDFAVLDSVASFVRLVISWLCYIGAVFCCLKIWSRF